MAVISQEALDLIASTNDDIQEDGQLVTITRQGEKVCVTDTVGAELQPATHLTARILITEQENTREGGTIKALVGNTPDYTPEVDDILTAVSGNFSFSINSVSPLLLGEALIYNTVLGAY